MAKHKRRRRSANRARRRRSSNRSYRRRSNPIFAFAPARRRKRSGRKSHRRRRNPSLRGLASKFGSSNTLKAVGEAGAAFLGARLIPQNVPFISQYNTGFVGYGLNLGAGLLSGFLASKLLGKQMGLGTYIGTALAVGSRFMVEQGNAASGGGVNGDLDFDLGYYISEDFPMRNDAAAGPYGTFPGSPRTGYMLPTAATAVKAGAAAAAAVPSLPAGSSGWRNSGRW